MKKICSFCHKSDLYEIIDFGKVALAGGFIKKNQLKSEPKFRLRVFFCANCYAVQVIDKVDQNRLFKNYYYFSSYIDTLKTHFEDYASNVVQRFIDIPSKSTVVEFGCNDGVLLNPLSKKKIKNLIGVDPAINIINKINIKNVNIINNFFNIETSKQIAIKYDKADLILANNVFAHIPDIREATLAVKNLLKINGVFIFEVHYLGKIIEELQYDMIYHEHLYYYSLIALENFFSKYDLKIFDVNNISTHGGSIRCYVSNTESVHCKKIKNSVTRMRNKEIQNGFNNICIYKSFAKSVSNLKSDLVSLIIDLKKKNKVIAGYGASGRANTVLQYLNITDQLISYMIDDSPEKIGLYTPGSNLEIKPRSVLLSKNPPDYVIVFAWSFLDEIRKKNLEYLSKGGKFISPFPEIKIL